VPQVYNGASFSPQDVAFSHDGFFLASVTGAGHVTVWNVTDPARAVRIATVTGLHDFVQAIAFSPRRCYGAPTVPLSLPAIAARSAPRRRSSADNVAGAEVCPAQSSRGSPGVNVS